MTRRERTRHLIELGGLVAKAGLVDLTDDDRAVIFGLLVEAAAQLRGPDREHLLLLWRRRGSRAFADEGSMQPGDVDKRDSTTGVQKPGISA